MRECPYGGAPALQAGPGEFEPRLPLNSVSMALWEGAGLQHRSARRKGSNPFGTSNAGVMKLADIFSSNLKSCGFKSRPPHNSMLL